MITPDLITRSNRKTLSLSILKDGQIVIKAPLKMSNETIQKFVYEKQKWIREKLAIIENNQTKYQEIISYQKFLLFGNRYSLKFADVKKIQTSSEEMVIYIPNNIPKEKVLSKLKAWYKKTAKTTLEQRLDYITKLIKLCPTSMKISDSKGRWGVCTSKGTISFNFRVIMLEPEIIDYVIIHELCHLVEMNHSKRFWNLVTSFMPSAPAQKQKIKEYSFLLSMLNG